ncbi:MAG: hypothetical protein AAF491_08635, partial [Verrucomicrobiota bacterium]
HSLKPLLLDPDGEWSGPDVAITALSGKDHSQHREFIGTLYPHFSVRSEDWRYSLTSDGQEELYHYPSDPNEFTNLANDPEHAAQKEQLREKLIALRDGPHWEDLDEFPGVPLAAFELVAEVKGAFELQLGGDVVAAAEEKDWSPIRVRVAGNRSQVWVNHRVHSDEVGDSEIMPGTLAKTGGELRHLRIRKL